MQRIDLEALTRERVGKGAARQIRREGRIPAILYGAGKSTPMTLDPSAVIRILKSESGENALLNLTVKEGDKLKSTITAIIRDYQRDPVSGEFLHADLFEVSMTEILRIKIPLIMAGDPIGVKEGGVLQHGLRELDIECLPADIPEHLDVPIGELAIGQSVHVRDLSLASGIKVLDDRDQIIVAVAAPITEAELEKILAVALVEGEGQEPEVASKGKEKIGEEGAPSEGEAAKKSETGK